MNTVGSLKLGSETDGGGESDDGRLGGGLLGLSDGSGDTGEIAERRKRAREKSSSALCFDLSRSILISKSWKTHESPFLT